MNKSKILALVAIIGATALVVSSLATTAAFANTSFSLSQSNEQKLEQSGIVNLGTQDALNNLCVLTGTNCGRTTG